jgi:ribonuclease P protein subunit RPR2
MTVGPEETTRTETTSKAATPEAPTSEISEERGSTKARDARRLCAGLLAEVAATFETDQAVLYATADRDRLVFVVESAGEWAEATYAPGHERQTYRDKRVDASAIQALRTASRHIAHGEYRHSGDFVAVPCSVDSEVVAVAVLRGVPSELSATAEADETTLLALGLAVERYQVQLALQESLAESEAARRQLDAYAIDLRSTYHAEKDRSHELASALEELTKTYEWTVRGLAIAVEAKDEYTGGHLQRVSRYGMAITEVVAPDHAGDPQFEYGFLLHDVGKLVVPDAILMKEGPLNEQEWAVIRAHSEAGRTILDRIPFLTGATEIVYAHHERWDGRGYPRGLHGEEIPLGARIFPLADAFDAMTTRRPYREAISVEEARLELERGSGTQFCPSVVEAFMGIATDDLEAVRSEAHRESSR